MRYRIGLTGLATVMATIMAQPALAQEAAPAEGASGGTLEDIVVTARKRTENLQDTPIAISAFSGAGLETRGITNITDVSNVTPSLSFTNSAPLSGNPAAAVVFLRGVGQIDFAIHTDPGVGIYVDGVYVARSVGSVLDLVDLERVEVLRGPQGTLFGRNTIGGAVNIVSRMPARELKGKADLTLGTDNRVQFQTSIDVPLSDTLFAQFTGFRHVRDGYVDRLLTGEKMGDDDVFAGRAQLLWEPSENFNALISVDATRRREKSAPNVAIALDGEAFPLAFLENLRIIGGPVCSTDPNSSRECWGQAWETGDPYSTNGTRPTKANVDIFGTSLTMNWTSDAFGIKSITAYREMDAVFGRDTDHSPFEYLFSSNDQSQHQFSQEFQLTGKAFEEKLKWLLGAYYFEEKAFDDYISSGSVNGVEGLNHVDNMNYAFFGEGTFDITDSLHFTAGVRYTHEKKRFRTDQKVIAGIRLPIGTPIVVDDSWQSRSFDEVTPRFTLAYDIAQGLMTYATYSKGFKSGGFNARYSSPVPAPIPYDPEKATLYEFGAKYETPARNFRLNVAAFRTDYDNVQVDFSVPGVLGTLVGNAAAARIEGVEAEASFAPIRGLSIDGSVGYLDARYTEVDASVPGIMVDNRLPLAPEWTTNLAISYAIESDVGTFTPRFDWSYRSRVYWDAINTAIISQGGYSLVNASLTWESTDEHLHLTAGVKNLTDEQYLTSAAYSDAAGVAEGVYARPRQWYVSAGFNF